MAEFVHTTPLLSYTLCRVNYESCSLLAYFFAVGKTRHTLLPCKSIWLEYDEVVAVMSPVQVGGSSSELDEKGRPAQPLRWFAALQYY